MIRLGGFKNPNELVESLTAIVTKYIPSGNPSSVVDALTAIVKQYD